jgi:DNA-binding MarR family transcriptional regulator
MPKSQKPDATKVWGALVSIAMSARQRGWTRIQFTDEVTRNERQKVNGKRRWTSHRLWWQLKSFSRNDPHAFRSLDRAWDIAAENLRGTTLRTPEDLKATAVETAFLWSDRLLAGTDGLTDSEILVMDYVVQETERRGMTRVTCPARAVGEHAKVSPMTASRKLKKLAAQGFPVQHSPGHGGSEPSRRRAAIYSLTDPEGPRAGMSCGTGD